MADNRHAWFHDRNSQRYRMVSFLSKVTKGFVKSPFYHATIAFYEGRREKDLEEDKIHDGEHVTIPAIWTVEFFSPANIQNLYRALSKLEAVGHTGIKDGPAEWVRRQRPRPGSSLNLYLIPEGRKGFGSGFRMPLPSFAETAGATVLTFTPSLTALVTYFILKEPEQSILDTRLHEDHPTRIIPTKNRSLRISSPSFEHKALVKEKRLQWLREATCWHKDHFPGLFSLAGQKVASCELSIIDDVAPFPLKGSNNNLLNALGFTHSSEVFYSGSGYYNPGLLFTRHTNDDGPKEFSYLSARKSDFDKIDTDGFGSGTEAAADRIDMSFRRTFAVVSISSVLQYYANKASETRDAATAIIGSANATKALSRVRQDLARCLDAITIARELSSGSDSIMLRYDELGFTLRPDSFHKEELSLVDGYADLLKRQGDVLLSDVKELNDGLNVQASLLSAHANLKLQPWIIILALISMFAGIVAAIGPAQSLVKEWSRQRKFQIERKNFKTTEKVSYLTTL